jgi:hypothetical protein
MKWFKIPSNLSLKADWKDRYVIVEYGCLYAQLEREPTEKELAKHLTPKQRERLAEWLPTLREQLAKDLAETKTNRKSRNINYEKTAGLSGKTTPYNIPYTTPNTTETIQDQKRIDKNISPYNPPSGDSSRFISLWNTLSDEFKNHFPCNRPIPRLASGREVPDLYRRTQDLNGLVKDLLQDSSFATEFEKYDDAWAWAFSQMWKRICKCSFLRGEIPGNEQHPNPFVFKVSFVMRKKNFMALVSPNDPTYER